MKLFVSICLLAAVNAVFEEPEPINDQEKNDEIAQSQKRVKWIACLSIASETLEANPDAVKTAANSNKNSDSFVRKKIAADILENCSSKITWKQAEEVLTENRSEKLVEFVKSVSQFDLQQFKQQDLKLTASQLELLEQITTEMNKEDDGFDQPNPVVEGVEEIASKDDNVKIIYIASGIVILLGLYLIFSGSEKPKEEKDAETRRKKRE